ncbi:MAG TPA: response regulator [Myxococcales bacterium]|nr:response regulator [Myxococcales bacterium]
MSVVLVADDEPAVLDALSQVVEDLGHQVVRAHDGREALQLARTQKPNLVVTDHMMPRLSGLDLVRQLREDDHLRDVPVLLLSAALPLGTSSEARAFLPKPFELSDFEQLVERLLAESTGGQGPRPPPEPPATPDERLYWLTHQVASPLALMRSRLELLQHGTDLSNLDAVRKQLGELERAVDELDRLVHKVTPPRH